MMNSFLRRLIFTLTLSLGLAFYLVTTNILSPKVSTKNFDNSKSTDNACLHKRKKEKLLLQLPFYV